MIWTVLIIAGLPGLWLWTTLARGRLGTPPAQRPQQTQRKQSKRSAPAKLLPILAVERRDVALSVGRRPVPLAPAGATSALTVPVHDRSLAREPVAVAEKPATNHYDDR